jgi:cell filamentation protein
VNTRSQHVFFNQLARDAGWVINWSKIPGDVFAHARTLAIVEDHSGLDALIRPNLITVEDATHADRLRARLDEHPQGFTTRRKVRDPATLDRALDAARQQRRSLPPPDAFGGTPPRGPHSDPSLGL